MASSRETPPPPEGVPTSHGTRPSSEGSSRSGGYRSQADSARWARGARNEGHQPPEPEDAAGWSQGARGEEPQPPRPEGAAEQADHATHESYASRASYGSEASRTTHGGSSQGGGYRSQAESVGRTSRTRGGGPRPPEPEGATGRTSHAGLPAFVKVIIGVFCAITLLQVVAGAYALSSVTVGLASCAGSLSDPPIGDSPETTAFIEDKRANDYDRITIDALRGVLDSLYMSKLGPGEQPMPIDTIRNRVAQGAWPDRLHAFGDITSSTNPQLWVRLAELADQWLTKETGEYWEVVDFAYPFPNNGPIPVPPTRDEGDAVTTRLVCTEGEDKGLYVRVYYYRWQRPASFECDLEYARAERQEQMALLEEMRALDDCVGRQILLDGNDLFLWETGEDDPLRDPDRFCAFASAQRERLGDYAQVTLLAADAPVRLYYSALSYDYPYEREDALPSLEEGQEMLLGGDYTWHVSNAFTDELLSINLRDDEAVTIDRLSGTLVEEGPDSSPDSVDEPDQDEQAA